MKKISRQTQRSLVAQVRLSPDNDVEPSDSSGEKGSGIGTSSSSGELSGERSGVDNAAVQPVGNDERQPASGESLTCITDFWIADT